MTSSSRQSHVNQVSWVTGGQSSWLKLRLIADQSAGGSVWSPAQKWNPYIPTSSCSDGSLCSWNLPSIRSREAAERTVLLETDAQGSEGPLVLTKLQAEGIRDMRKSEWEIWWRSSGRAQESKQDEEEEGCVSCAHSANGKIQTPLMRAKHEAPALSVLNCLCSAQRKNWNKRFWPKWEQREASEIFKPPSLLCHRFVPHWVLHLVCASILHKKER